MMRLLNFLFGCHHEYSRVFTLRPLVRRAKKGWPAIWGNPRTYQVCCKCGREREINWESFGVMVEDEFSRTVEVESL